MTSKRACWVLTTGETGHRSQAMGLAEAVGLPIVEKRIGLGAPWSWLPGGALPIPLSAIGSKEGPLEPPWPRLTVSCGHRTIGPALAVKRRSGRTAMAVHLMNPELARSRFDLVVAMEHDALSGPNVIAVRTALHGVTRERLVAEGNAWHGKLAAEGAPILGILIGGDTGRARLTATVVERLVGIIRAAHAGHGFIAAATPSRRTDEATKRMLESIFEREALGTIWSGSGENPYLGILALSRRLVVTGDSVSMVSEALATGRPVHVLPLEHQGHRHEMFLRRLADGRLVSLIEGNDLDWNFAGQGPVDATGEVAEHIRGMLERTS
jgi:mitochondrial fission protein ELM1